MLTGFRTHDQLVAIGWVFLRGGGYATTLGDEIVFVPADTVQGGANLDDARVLDFTKIAEADVADVRSALGRLKTDQEVQRGSRI